MRFPGKLAILLALGLVAFIPKHVHAQVSWYGITNRGSAGSITAYSHYPGAPLVAGFPHQVGYYSFSYYGPSFYVPPFAPSIYTGRAYGEPGFSPSGASLYGPRSYGVPLYARPPY